MYTPHEKPKKSVVDLLTIYLLIIHNFVLIFQKIIPIQVGVLNMHKTWHFGFIICFV